MIRALETAALVFGVIAGIGLYALFWIYVTDADSGRAPRLKRALVCWWYHRWRREGNSWDRPSCSSCEHVEYGLLRAVRDAYWDEVERAVGTGTPSILLGTSTRALRKSLTRLRKITEED
jgi:hypothetical protein